MPTDSSISTTIDIALGPEMPESLFQSGCGFDLGLVSQQFTAKREAYKFIVLSQQQMTTSLYYKVSPTGYHKSYQTPPPHVDYSRQIPVYRVVNQFMNLRDEEPSPPEAPIQKSKFYVDIARSAASENGSTTSQIRYISREQMRSEDRDDFETTIIDEEISQFQHSKEKHMSSRDLKVSEVGTVVKGKMQPNASTPSIDNVTAASQYGKQKILEFELQKERILRVNLEKSYQHLLNTLRSRQSKLYLNEEQFSVAKQDTVPLRPQTDRNPKSKGEFLRQSSQEDSQNRIKMRKSCCVFQQRPELMRSCKQDSMQFEGGEQFHQYFETEKWFQEKLKDEIQLLHQKIEAVDRVLKSQEIQSRQSQQRLLFLEKQNCSLRLQLQVRAFAEQQDQKRSKQEGLTKKEHMHYIFTILIMFLCFAMFAKSKQ